jgi:hypothetical protein
MYVEVFETTGEGQKLWFKVYTKDGVVDLSEVPKKLKDTWVKYGIPYKGKRVNPYDGEVFLQAVARDMNGSMTRSSDVRSDDEQIIGS